MNKMTFIATGDAFTTRRIPADGYPGLEELQEVIGASGRARNTSQ